MEKKGNCEEVVFRELDGGWAKNRIRGGNQHTGKGSKLTSSEKTKISVWKKVPVGRSYTLRDVLAEGAREKIFFWGATEFPESRQTAQTLRAT